MSKLTRALTVGVTMAAIAFAGMTTAARADVNHDVVNRHRAWAARTPRCRRP